MPFFPFQPAATGGYPANPVVSGPAAAGTMLVASSPTAAAWQAADATAADIAQDSVQGPGVSAKWPNSDHVHPAFAGIPGDNGLLACSELLGAVNTTGAALTAGVFNLIRIPIRYAFTATNLWIIVGTAGVGASTGSFAGLISPAGTLLTGSADIAASLTATGAKQLALTTPQAVTPTSFTQPWMWAVILVNLATTQPGLRSNTSDTPTILNLNLAAASSRVAANGTAQTALASITPSANTNTNAHPFWVGVT